MKFIKAVAAVFLGSASLAAGENILEVATSNGFDTLVSAISAAGLVDELSGEGPFTVFAPSEDAFAALPSGALQYLLRSPDKLRAVLLDHVVDGDVLSSALNDGQVLVTLADASLFVSIDGSEVMINDATVVGADNIALNGVIHVIDTVLIQDSFYFPPTIVGIATGDAAFTTLATALQAANLEATLSGEGPFTLLAPSDGAFAKLPSGTLQFLLRNTDILTTILSYHVIDEYVRYSDIGYGTGTTVLPTLADASVTFYHDGVPGTGTTINNYDAAFVDVDNVAVNGVIHTIDHVLIPEGLTITPSIVDFVTDKSAFLNLAQFLGATGLIETLRGAGPFSTCILGVHSEIFFALDQCSHHLCFQFTARSRLRPHQ
jgi:transforming growth factor-beta-induced protein